MADAYRTIGITGVTGNIGGKVAHRLAAGPSPLVLLARSPSKVTAASGEVRRCDFADEQGAYAALSGVDTLLMVSAAETPDRVDQHRTFIDAAARAGVQHLVYTSIVGASAEATFTLARDHWATEEHLRSSGLPHTILRDALYADFLPLMVGEDGVIRGPAADGRAAVVAQDDVAAVAAVVLLDPAEHVGATYDLTGPEALTMGEAAAIATEVLGWSVGYQPETVEEAYASRAVYGAPQWQVDAWVSTYTAIAEGEQASVSDAVPRLTGHPALSLREVLERQEGLRAAAAQS
jgi:NAD(P)H dehydrogenase (quinone)